MFLSLSMFFPSDATFADDGRRCVRRFGSCRNGIGVHSVSVGATRQGEGRRSAEEWRQGLSTGVAIVADVLHVFCVCPGAKHACAGGHVEYSASCSIVCFEKEKKQCNRPYIPLYPGLGRHQHGKSPAARLKLQHHSP